MSNISNHDGKLIILKRPQFPYETSIAARTATKVMSIFTTLIDTVLIIVIKPLVIQRSFRL